MEIMRNGSRPSQKGPEQYFTGVVRIDPIIQAPELSRVTGGLVTFEPGARSAWHTHPLGQTLIVTQGVGWTHCEGEIRAGDVVWCPPNHRHWHGATPTTAMAHIATRSSSTAKTWNGWKRSPTSNTLPASNQREGATAMPDNGRKAFGDIAPALANIQTTFCSATFGKGGPEARDRSLVTSSDFLYRTNELPFHLKKALGTA